MEIILPTVTTWAVENSHLVLSHQRPVPEILRIQKGVMGLERSVQFIADGKDISDGRPPMGLISFRYEAFEGVITMVHCYFLNKHDKLSRFMRLRRLG